MTDLQVIHLNHEIHNRGEDGQSRRPGAAKDPGIQLKDSERTRCEVWTRVMGYHRPVSAFNAGKQSEHGERQYFTECPAATAEQIDRVA
ncbi:MAG: hypothetical protein [Olavius algarvensis Gamma 1 endosymbiont]|nr:MAG: hypothetical protein [Olavius algarvensis Gamma 1 endosymbiont]